MARKYPREMRNTLAENRRRCLSFFIRRLDWIFRGAPDGVLSMLWAGNAIGNGSAGKTIAGMPDEGLEYSGVRGRESCFCVVAVGHRSFDASSE